MAGPILGSATAVWCVGELAAIGTSAWLASRTVANGGRVSAEIKDEVDADNEAAHGGVQKCTYCGVEVTADPGKPNSKEYDHRLPWSKGGAADATNICIACRTDNRKKGSMTDDEYRKTLSDPKPPAKPEE